MRHPHERVGAFQRGRRRTVLVGVPLALAATVLAGLGATPATAHDVLLASEPADGEVLLEAPAVIVLRFSAEQLDVGTAVEVRAASGTRWDRGAAEVAGAEVTQALDTGMPAGAYEVRWRSVSSDGHPLSDAFTFEVAESSGEPEPGTGESDGPRPSEAEPAAAAPNEAAPSATPVAPPVPTPDGASPAVLVVVVLGVLGAAAAVLLRLHRRSS